MSESSINNWLTLSPEEWTVVWLSLWVSSWSVVVSLPFGIALGYWLARTQSRCKWLLETAVNLTLVIPPVVTGYLLLVLLGRRGLVGSYLHDWFGVSIAFTPWAAVIAAAVISFPLLVRSTRMAFQAVNPRLEIAARSLGATRWDAFLTISLPLAMRGIIAGAVLAFARSLGEFGATIMFAGNIAGETRTLAIGIYFLSEQPGGMEKAQRLVLLSILIAGLALVVSEYLERRASRHERT